MSSNVSAVSFEKVSFKVFAEDMKKHNPKLTFTDDILKGYYDEIKVPSALYRANKQPVFPFYSPKDYYFTSKTNEDGSMDLIIPTGIKCILEDGYYLVEGAGTYVTPYAVTIASPTKVKDAAQNNIIYPKYFVGEEENIILNMHLFEKSFRAETRDAIFYAILMTEEELKELNNTEEKVIFKVGPQRI